METLQKALTGFNYKIETTGLRFTTLTITIETKCIVIPITPTTEVDTIIHRAYSFKSYMELCRRLNEKVKDTVRYYCFMSEKDYLLMYEHGFLHRNVEYIQASMKGPFILVKKQ